MSKTTVFEMSRVLKLLRKNLEVGIFEAVLVSTLPSAGGEGEKTSTIDTKLMVSNQIVSPLHFANKTQLCIGRARTNDIHLDSRHVSRVHAYFTKTEAGICLIDNDSSNGTYLDGNRLTPYSFFRLADAAQIKFGLSCESYTVWQFYTPSRFEDYLSLLKLF